MRSVPRRTEALRGRAFQACCKPSRDVGRLIPGCTPTPTGPDLDALITRAHGGRLLRTNMGAIARSRTAGCPSVERNRRTAPTGGASPVSIPEGIDSPAALRHPGRADALKRRRMARAGILGRRWRRLQSPLWKERRPTLSRCLVHPAVGDAVDRRQTPQPNPVRQASRTDAGFFRKIQSASAVRTLDFRDHVTPVPPQAAPTAREQRSHGVLGAATWYRYCGSAGAGPWPSTYWCFVPVM